ncbi:MAG: hypothetical protein OXC68_09030 [Aestuariivita sp.]|nr:hypothetical protein [Aestuariivita sp.]
MSQSQGGETLETCTLKGMERVATYAMVSVCLHRGAGPPADGLTGGFEHKKMLAL